MGSWAQDPPLATHVRGALGAAVAWFGSRTLPRLRVRLPHPSWTLPFLPSRAWHRPTAKALAEAALPHPGPCPPWVGALQAQTPLPRPLGWFCHDAHITDEGTERAGACQGCTACWCGAGTGSFDPPPPCVSHPLWLWASPCSSIPTVPGLAQVPSSLQLSLRVTSSEPSTCASHYRVRPLCSGPQCPALDWPCFWGSVFLTWDGAVGSVALARLFHCGVPGPQSRGRHRCSENKGSEWH